MDFFRRLGDGICRFWNTSERNEPTTMRTTGHEEDVGVSTNCLCKRQRDPDEISTSTEDRSAKRQRREPNRANVLRSAARRKRQPNRASLLRPANPAVIITIPGSDLIGERVEIRGKEIRSENYAAILVDNRTLNSMKEALAGRQRLDEVAGPAWERFHKLNWRCRALAAQVMDTEAELQLFEELAATTHDEHRSIISQEAKKLRDEISVGWAEVARLNVDKRHGITDELEEEVWRQNEIQKEIDDTMQRAFEEANLLPSTSPLVPALEELSDKHSISKRSLWSGTSKAESDHPDTPSQAAAAERERGSDHFDYNGGDRAVSSLFLPPPYESDYYDYSCGVRAVSPSVIPPAEEFQRPVEILESQEVIARLQHCTLEYYQAYADFQTSREELADERRLFKDAKARGLRDDSQTAFDVEQVRRRMNLTSALVSAEERLEAAKNACKDLGLWSRKQAGICFESIGTSGQSSREFAWIQEELERFDPRPILEWQQGVDSGGLPLSVEVPEMDPWDARLEDRWDSSSVLAGQDSAERRRIDGWRKRIGVVD
ncbi:hypothetical protein NA57DRAFT_50818 [Rhizodiscina lignyota]|uniref:Uncharacterized protein n=1 Tax=Rhizodiscina lignyota TaxID=1504668 RepID=A0A9P4MAH0_9PEZI|nr:hypothetical protein NA57DRAFT_50818 [Rhizodiscina lignyota]